MRVVAVTTSRADYGIHRPVLAALSATPGIEVQLLVGGSHLREDHGGTLAAVEEDGYPVAAVVDMLDAADDALGTVRAMARAVAGFGEAIEACRPDLLLVLGDRFEMHAAALAALPLLVPVVHIHGGEVTEGAIDDALRHSMTKLSHLHVVSTEAHGRRVRQLGEEPWRVLVAGAPGLDNLLAVDRLGPSELAADLGLPLDPAPVVVTFHPVTLEPDERTAQVEELLAGVADVARPFVVTAPNADAGGGEVRRRLEAFVAERGNRVLVHSLGTRRYASLLSVAAVMVGNSSSGIIEAPSFGLPVVNVGSRQDGRVRAANVLDVPPERAAIAAAVSQALDPAFRDGLADLANPYGDGQAAGRIVEWLRGIDRGPALLRKRFVDG